MPELPDITLYLEALEKRVLGQALENVRILSPFLLRTAVPPIQDLCGRKAGELRRIGKRMVFGFEGDLWLVVHLMIAGRLHWVGQEPATSRVGESEGGKPGMGAPRRKPNLAGKQAVFEFGNGTLLLTEAGTKRRASIHVVQGEARLAALNPGGLEVLECTAGSFEQTLTSQNHTLKRALTDPRLFSGIGNAYSDEILHRARLSPVALSQRLSAAEIERLYRARKRR